MNNANILAYDSYVRNWDSHDKQYRSVQKDPSSPVLRLSKERPQLLGRAERTKKYMSTAKRRERRWRSFSTLPEVNVDQHRQPPSWLSNQYIADSLILTTGPTVLSRM